MGVPRCIKFESSLRYKAVIDCPMPYFVALMMTGFKFLEDLENNQINLWSERKPIVLDKTIVEVWNK